MNKDIGLYKLLFEYDYVDFCGLFTATQEEVDDFMDKRSIV